MHNQVQKIQQEMALTKKLDFSIVKRVIEEIW